ncbi:MAG: AbrB/MazE/SpoVT family DNA-binding domain-containing protein [Chloroflexia bacterium]|nr:AbrB/MazE/SpoVT family DNA-binding domain-containing protein [Chloroflexia bacterium]
MIEATTTAQSLRVDEQGRVTVPSRLGQSLGYQPGDDLVAWVENDQLIIQSRQAIAEDLWAMFADIEGSLVDELIEERRAEARREFE